jgi:hypothetical protein
MYQVPLPFVDFRETWGNLGDRSWSQLVCHNEATVQSILDDIASITGLDMICITLTGCGSSLPCIKVCKSTFRGLLSVISNENTLEYCRAFVILMVHFLEHHRCPA